MSTRCSVTSRLPDGSSAPRDWPLSELEEAAIKPIYHAFRLDMAAWELDHGLRTGQYDLTAIERQLSRTGTRSP
jgi:hypothetical protein